MKRAIAFTRVSTAKQDEGVRQLDQIRKYCSGVGYELLESKTISEIISGASEFDERKELKKLLKLTKTDADIIIVSESSRLTRKNEADYTDLLQIVKAIQRTGLDLYILGSGQTYTADVELKLVDVIILAIEADRNAKERETIKQRLKTGKISKVKQGCFLGNLAPYGFNAIPNPKKTKTKEFGSTILEVNEAESVNVKMLFDLVGNRGFTIRGTAIQMNGLNIKKDGKDWTFSAVKNILRQEIYTGKYTYLGESNDVPAIITKELFNLVRVNIKNNHLQLNKGHVNYNLLKSLVKCPCGGNMSLNTRDLGLYYNCIKKHSSYITCTCKNYGINAELLNKIVWQITKAFITDKDFELKVQEVTKKMAVQIEIKENQFSKLSEQLQSVTAGIELSSKNLLKATTDTTFKIFEDDVIAKTKEQSNLNNIIERTTKELLKLNNQLSNYRLNIDADLLDSLTEQQKNEIYLKYIEKVTYYSVTKFKGFIHIIYKDGSEAVVMTESFRDKIAYQLPVKCSFNPVTRKVINSFEEFEAGVNFSIPRTVNNESDYNKTMKLYHMELLNMDREESSEELQMIYDYDTEQSRKLAKIY